MTYENPSDYIEDEKQRLEMLEKALELAELKKTDDTETSMSAEDVVNAAEKFNDFVEKT